MQLLKLKTRDMPKKQQPAAGKKEENPTIRCPICIDKVKQGYLKRHQKRNPSCRVIQLKLQLAADGWVETGLFSKAILKNNRIPFREEPTQHYRGGWGSASSTYFHIYTPAWFNALMVCSVGGPTAWNEWKDGAGIKAFFIEARQVAKSARLQYLTILEAVMGGMIHLTSTGNDPYSVWLKRLVDTNEVIPHHDLSSAEPG